MNKVVVIMRCQQTLFYISMNAHSVSRYLRLAEANIASDNLLTRLVSVSAPE